MVKEFEELPSISNYSNIEDIQKDAWNAAIKWCAKNAEVLPSDDFYSSIDKQSILDGLID